MGQKIDIPTRGGGNIRCDADVAPRILSVMAQLDDDAEKFHEILMSLGVKAYRCNDGWVDRERLIATFFDNEKTKGWYWSGEMNIKKGDLIAIGNVDSGAMIMKAVADANSFSRFSMKVPFSEDIEAIVDGFDKGKRTPSRYRPKTLSLWKRVFSAIGIIERHDVRIF